MLQQTLEYADKVLQSQGFSLFDHGSHEYRIASYKEMHKNTKRSLLRQSYITRLEQMMQFMNAVTKRRAERTILNLRGQDNELIGHI